MAFKEYKRLDLVAIQKEVQTYWKEENIFEKSISERERKNSFTFYEGPPSANGKPGIHHVMARTIKDVFCRFKTLEGYQVKRKGGWDTHGLPVELEVEKALGITKEDIGKNISVEEYNQKCREAVMKYKGLWDELTTKMGFWLDLEHPYVTFEKNYIESVWALLKRLYDKNLLYKGYTIQPYSPAAGTGLSSHELNQPEAYKKVKDVSIVAQFKLKNQENTFFLAWTTTPWTLPSNTGLAVGKNIKYVKVQTFNPYTHEPVFVILAEDLLSKYFTEKQKQARLADFKKGDKVVPYDVVEYFKGSDLENIEYEQLMPYVQPVQSKSGRPFRVVIGDFVRTEDGTGIVHLAPTFGADDMRIAKQNDLPPLTVKDEHDKDIPLVNRQGQFVDEVTDFAACYVKDDYGMKEGQDKPTDVLIAIFLKEQGKAFHIEKYEHNYPHCWRTKKPVLYYPLDSWFIRTTAVREEMVTLNKTINWQPTATGTGRFGNWLENVVDWNLSRSRYWGSPLPIWRTEDGKEEKCIGSLKELEAEIRLSMEAGIMPSDYTYWKDDHLSEEFDLHRPFVDEIVLVSSKGEAMHREPDLIDVWFDSGAMPYAEWHYPFENEDIFEKSFPADFVSEGVDQTRGWFYTLHALATMLYGKVAFKNIVSTGLVLDKNGNKMSKSVGNTIDPFETIDKYSADATRWYMMENALPWDNLKFDIHGVVEGQKKFFGTLFNTYNFFALYANLDYFDNFDFSESYIPLSKRPESDKWIISKLHSLIAEVKEAYQNYNPTKAARAIQEFTIDHLSNWYVRLNRKRFWKSAYNEDKIAAYQSLYECLLGISKMMSPIAPFYAEQLFQDLNKCTKQDSSASVHLSSFPKSKPDCIHKEIEENMHWAQKVCSLGHSIRKKEKIKTRQPLNRILIPHTDERITNCIKAMQSLICLELNIKKIDFSDGKEDHVFVKKAKPNFSLLGRKYGRDMGLVKASVEAMSKEQIAAYEANKEVELVNGDKAFVLLESEIEIYSDDVPGWSIAKQDNLTVALDIAVDDTLKAEGLARELVNRIQNLRKDKGFDVQDKVHILFDTEDTFLKGAILAFSDYICEETQALSLKEQQNNGQKLDIEGQELSLELEK